MIKLKDILLENTAPNLLIPRRVEGRVAKMIQQYIKNGSQGDFSLSKMKLTKLPDVLKYVDVSGNFLCYNNQLTSLENAPKSVSGGFYCNYNKLTSLIGAPQSVGGNFNCDNNQLTSLEGAPESIGGGFYCHNNQLTSLDNAPKSVSGDFACYNNLVEFTEEQVKEVCNVKGNITV